MWWAYFLIFYGGVVVGFVICALLSIDRAKIADEAEAWLRRQR